MSAALDVASSRSDDDLARVRAAVSAPTEPPLSSAAQRAAAMDAARAALAPSLTGRTAPTYPVESLGPLAPACKAIASAAQVQPAMVGQALLGAASLLTQGLFNVETLAGVRPLSLYLLTLGDSGDGKSMAQGAALRPVDDWQRARSTEYAQDLKNYERTKGNRKKGDEPPELPSCPFRLVGDATVEGLRRDLDGGVCSQGVFTDEAAAILSGHGMSADHRSKTAGVFSKLWDHGHLSFSRATTGRVERYGRRVALHWLIQPMAASESIGDPLLSALGFWPRFLVAWPEPQAPRRCSPFRPNTLPNVGDYWKRCSDLLGEPLPDDAATSPTIALSANASTLLGTAFERFEQDARGGDLRSVKPFGLRASEQACRVAGVLAAFAGEHVVSVEQMRGALSLVAYSVATWQAIIDEGAADPRGADALRLFQYLTGCDDWSEKLAAIVNRGPACVRSKERRDAALSVLEAAGLVYVVDGRATALPPPTDGPAK